MAFTIDLNADLGEHPNSDLDERIMPYLSSCNIACGGHIGNAESVKYTVELAKQFSIKIGAHPSFPDSINFGRKVMNIHPDKLKSSLKKQIDLVNDSAERSEIPLHHVKPHGALYNLAAYDQETSALICEVIAQINPKLKLYGLAHAIIEKVAGSYGLQFVPEAFADRQYRVDRTLLPRSEKGAVLSNEKNVLDQVEELVFNKRVFADCWISIDSETICLHSDTKGAINLAAKIRKHLESKGAIIAAV
ncbi:MAG: 5-oxoprolinase subunit PxpA [Bacteroidota bacterium]